MTEVFRPAFAQAAADKVIDRTELLQLRALKDQLQKSEPGSEPARSAVKALQGLDAYTGKTRLNHPVNQPEGQTLYYEFVLTPTYSESELVPGKTPLEIVSNLSQGDSLSDTAFDNERCSASALVNAYLLLGGDFAALAGKLGLPAEAKTLTYENAHRAQEALYTQANINRSKGLNIGENNRYAPGSSRIIRPEIVGESRIAAQKIGMKTHALMGATRETMSLREAAVRDFIAKHPKAPMHVAVKAGPPVSAPADFEQYDHAVTIYHEQGKFYLLDTGVNDNGASRAMRQLKPHEVKELLFESKGFVFGLTLDQP